MYFYYFDESGSYDPSADTAEKLKDHLYVLLTSGMYEGQWRYFDTTVFGLQLELVEYLHRDGKDSFVLADCEVKSNWVRILANVIDNRVLHNHFTHDTLHVRAYGFLLEHIQHYMRKCHWKHPVLIVMDATSRQLNRAVAMKYASYQQAGNRNIAFPAIVEFLSSSGWGNPRRYEGVA